MNESMAKPGSVDCCRTGQLLAGTGHCAQDMCMRCLLHLCLGPSCGLARFEDGLLLTIVD